MNNFTFLLFSSLILSVHADDINDLSHKNFGAMHMKTFANPGKYLLTKNDYKYAKNLIVEIWSGGGSGHFDLNGGCGGGSGAYIKASVPTMHNKKLMSFDIVVGDGGFNMSGGNSSFSSRNKINLIVTGGLNCAINRQITETGGKVHSTVGVGDYIAISGQKGDCVPYVYRQIMRGGNAPFGGSGGTTSNGIQPGGGGFGSLDTSGVKGGNGFPGGNGAAGMVVVQFVGECEIDM